MQEIYLARVSDWINAGKEKTGWILLGNEPKRSTEKALGFEELHRGYGKTSMKICWFPKSRIKPVQNDTYNNGPTMYLVPKWLFDAKKEEGFIIPEKWGY